MITETNPSYLKHTMDISFKNWRKVCLTHFIILMSCTVVYGQSFSVEPNPVSASADLDINPGLFQILANSLIFNQTNENLNMKWERIVNDKPECWNSSVDSPNFQSFPGIDSFEFTLLPNLPDGGDLIVHMYIEGFSGEGQVVLRVSNLDIPADTLIVTYNFIATGNNPCSPSSISETQKAELQLYPNPCADAFQLTESQDVHQLIVYNTLGIKVQQFYTKPKQIYNISPLPKGMYMVEMQDAEGSLLKTVKLLKH